MAFLRVYLRVLELLAAEASLAATLALANIALAVALFVEPVLFGRIVDALSGPLPRAAAAAALALAPLVGAWVVFGLFIIVASAVVAWFADRLAHRRRNLVLADFFEHVLQLPMSYHAGAHSGRQVKIMLAGTDALWWLWVSFFREHFAAFVFIFVLLPATVVLELAARGAVARTRRRLHRADRADHEPGRGDAARGRAALLRCCGDRQ